MSTFRIFLCILGACSSALAQSVSPYDTPCALFGPDFPVPSRPSSSTAIQKAIRNATSALQDALKNPTIYGQLDSKTTSFSLDWYSTHEEDAIFSYDHSAPVFANPTEGVAVVDSNTVYALGSISKLFSVYTWLIAVGDVAFNEPITKYVPEIAAYAANNAASLQISDIDVYDWEALTIGALASQLSGLPRDFSFGPIFEAVFQQAGLPQLSPTDISYCGNPLQVETTCNRSGSLQDVFSQHPTMAPFYSPTYSNVAYALENITGVPFVTTFEKQLIQPLQLNATSYFAPSTKEHSFISYNSTKSWYGGNYHASTPAGGYYSSVNDLHRMGTSILKSTLLSPAQTRRWLKPHSFTTVTNAAVGAPWEIYLAPINRTSWMYTKAGGTGLYATNFVLLPDYDAGFTVLARGSSAPLNVEIISEIITAAFVPALEAAAKEEANTVYAGTYGIRGTNMTIETDEYPGLGILEWNMNGTSVFDILGSSSFWTSESPQSQFTARLYPTGLMSRDGTQISFRAAYQRLPQVQDPGAFQTHVFLG